MSIHLEKVSTDHEDFGYLIELLDRDLWKRYPDTQQFFDQFNKVKLDAKAIVAYLDNKPVGCGCFREAADAGVVEMKRMFVLDEARGKGIAKAVLSELEQWAKQEGNRRAILETGTGQPEAIALYTKMGYDRIPNYEPYVGSDESVCMGKDL
ncbi:ribosomal protein S18 acetylase RimI-like enzyme [Paenibacillus taihuensis]|uniref:Ribosomal protein S18 acetylase RimI-like enzyme n=1 Tax=Paenibacillus taihuensis TaxID=1156355 RepID=A0A3D9SF78_9BACL|nr:GNAT family N-acetyltransferase [Paenibacillus taihuensis]REE94549.1 ribosomal protein S18 acetylase RimI-like enzyme [Paenibacillus taihuensis]